MRGPDEKLRALAPDGREARGGSAGVSLDSDFVLADALAANGIDVRPDYDPPFEPRADVRYAASCFIDKYFPPATQTTWAHPASSSPSPN